MQGCVEWIILTSRYCQYKSIVDLSRFIPHIVSLWWDTTRSISCIGSGYNVRISERRPVSWYWFMCKSQYQAIGPQRSNFFVRTPVKCKIHLREEDLLLLALADEGGHFLFGILSRNRQPDIRTKKAEVMRAYHRPTATVLLRRVVSKRFQQLQNSTHWTWPASDRPKAEHWLYITMIVPRECLDSVNSKSLLTSPSRRAYLQSVLSRHCPERYPYLLSIYLASRGSLALFLTTFGWSLS